MKVLAISGSLRRASHNTALLRAAAEHAPDGVEVDLPVGGVAAKFDDEGRLTDPETIERLEDAIVALLEHHRSLRVAA